MARAAAPETGAIAAMKTAAALVTRMALAPDVPREQVLVGSDPAEVLPMVEAFAAGVLKGAFPRDDGADVLERLGLLLADAEQGAGG